MFRKALPSDLPVVAACIRAAYEPQSAEIGVRLAPLDTDCGAAIARNEVHLSLTPAGDVEGLILFHAEPPVMHLDNVAVAPGHQGRGIGGKLISSCEREAGRLGCESVELYTNQKLVRNIAVCLHLGYQVTDRRLDEGFHRIFFRKLLPVGGPDG